MGKRFDVEMSDVAQGSNSDEKRLEGRQNPASFTALSPPT